MATETFSHKNFDRQYRLAAGQGGKTGFEIGEITPANPVPLHITFSLQKSDLETQNTGKIEVWNLSKEHMCKASVAIAYLLGSLYKQELDSIKAFADEHEFDDETRRDQLRCMWTAYCVRYDLQVDTSTYDTDILDLWSTVSRTEPETADWSDFDSFDDFMCAYLV